jgi:hypothetical protein
MFTSLEEQIKRDDNAVSTPHWRWLRSAVVLIVSVLLFGALYVGVRLLE